MRPAEKIAKMTLENWQARQAARRAAFDATWRPWILAVMLGAALGEAYRQYDHHTTDERRYDAAGV